MDTNAPSRCNPPAAGRRTVCRRGEDELALWLRRLAHDLRGPAGAVMLAATTLAAGHAHMTESDVAVAVTALQRAAFRVQDLAEQLAVVTEVTT